MGIKLGSEGVLRVQPVLALVMAIIPRFCKKLVQVNTHRA